MHHFPSIRNTLRQNTHMMLGSAVIDNIATSVTGKHADYRVRVGKKRDAGDLRRVMGAPQRNGIVRNHARLSQSVWRLVLKSLAAAFPEQRITLPDADSIEAEGITDALSAPDKEAL